jgi:hypothetical protein
MKKMKFTMSNVRNFLIENESVYTVRSWNDPDEVSIVSVEGVGNCKKKRIKQISKKEDLMPYLNESGFETLDSWWDKLERFKSTKGYLYNVSKVIKHKYGEEWWNII